MGRMQNLLRPRDRLLPTQKQPPLQLTLSTFECAPLQMRQLDDGIRSEAEGLNITYDLRLAPKIKPMTTGTATDRESSGPVDVQPSKCLQEDSVGNPCTANGAEV